MNHTVYILDSQNRIVVERNVIESVTLSQIIIFIFDDGTFCEAYACFNTRQQCLDFYGLVEIESGYILTITETEVPVEKFHFVTNFETEQLPIYKQSILVYETIYGENGVYEIREGSHLYPEGKSLWVINDKRDNSNFFKIFESVRKMSIYSHL